MKNSPFFCKGFIYLKLCSMSFFSTVCLIPTCYSLSFNKVNPIIQILIFLPRELQKTQNWDPCGRRGSIRIIFEKCKAIKVLFRTLPVHLEPSARYLRDLSPSSYILYHHDSWPSVAAASPPNTCGKMIITPLFPSEHQPTQQPSDQKKPSWVPKLIQRGQQLSFRPGEPGRAKKQNHIPPNDGLVQWWFTP